MRMLFDHMYEGVYFVDSERKILYWSKGAERISGFSQSEVEGFHCYDNILIHVNEEGVNLCSAGCPLSNSIKTKQECNAEAYLHHKQGHRVPVKMHILPMKDKKGEVFGAFEIFAENMSNSAMAERMKELEREALLDPLTELGNRRYFETNLYGKIKQLSRYDSSFGLLFIDIDDFKSINDDYGHDLGDRILIMIGKTLAGNLRPFDIVTRWGGEEFAIIIDKIDVEQLKERSEKLRMLVEKSAIFVEKKEVRVTISVGATLSRPKDTIVSIVKRSDALMYESKKAGKNKVTIG